MNSITPCWIRQLIDFIGKFLGFNPNREKDLDEAKKMYVDYDCNHFFMMKEGESKKYERFGVSRKQEKIWRDEYVAFWLEKLSLDDLAALWHLRNASARESIPKLISLAEKGDSYAKFWAADTILFLSSGFIERKRDREFAISILKSLVKDKIVISDANKSKIDLAIMTALNASTPEEYLINYSKRKLTDLRIKLSIL